MIKNVGFLNTNKKEECFGCESCYQICPISAITMKSDSEGFRYPSVDRLKCIKCNLCHKVCPVENPLSGNLPKKVFGGYSKNQTIRKESTSGGAFSELINSLFTNNTIVYGAASNDGLVVKHIRIEHKEDVFKIRKSKYQQSNVNCAFSLAKNDLVSGKNVVFSGTPCQIAGLKAFLGNTQLVSKLVTIEVICEGVPSPLFFDCWNKRLFEKYGGNIVSIDFRNKDKEKWDFQVMKIKLSNGKILYYDRWINPFWFLWISHLMSRPSCYECPFACQKRNSDITLGDLWGVHKYCPELYGKNGGASLIFANSDKGVEILKNAEKQVYGHYLDYDVALKYQGPLRRHIPQNPNRDEFLKDLVSLDYQAILKKWYKKPSFKLLFSKYVFGNNKKVFLWNCFHSKKDKTIH
jgi:coenzyme F420-reducing hydrogenase beta subunit